MNQNIKNNKKQLRSNGGQTVVSVFSKRRKPVSKHVDQLDAPCVKMPKFKRSMVNCASANTYSASISRIMQAANFLGDRAAVLIRLE